VLQVAVCPLVSVEWRLCYVGVAGVWGGGEVWQWTASGCGGDGFFD
jgi:hypothetical protein